MNQPFNLLIFTLFTKYIIEYLVSFKFTQIFKNGQNPRFAKGF
jgi:hypothetical protein